MNCPRCGSDNVQVQIIQERKYGSFLTFIVRLILFFWIFLLWLFSLLFRTSKIKNKTVAVCGNCGNTWTPNPRRDLAKRRKQERKLANSERRKELIDGTIESKFWQNEYFGYAMIFLLAPFGVFLMYKYNSRLSSERKKQIAIIALSIWTILFVLVALFGSTADNSTDHDSSSITQTQKVAPQEKSAPVAEEEQKTESGYMDALRKCTVMEAADIHTTGVGAKTNNAFNDGRDTCNSMFASVYESDETEFTRDVRVDWNGRKSETIDNRTLQYYLGTLGW